MAVNALGNKSFYPSQSLRRDTVSIEGTMLAGASGAVSTTDLPPGCSVTKTGTGEYTFTGPGGTAIYVFATLVNPANGDRFLTVKSQSANGGTDGAFSVVLTNIAAGAAANMTSGDSINILIRLRTSKSTIV